MISFKIYLLFIIIYCCKLKCLFWYSPSETCSRFLGSSCRKIPTIIVCWLLRIIIHFWFTCWVMRKVIVNMISDDIREYWKKLQQLYSGSTIQEMSLCPKPEMIHHYCSFSRYDRDSIYSGSPIRTGLNICPKNSSFVADVHNSDW